MTDDILHRFRCMYVLLLSDVQIQLFAEKKSKKIKARKNTFEQRILQKILQNLSVYQGDEA